MPKENTVPDELRGLIEKRSGKDRRKKSPGRISDDDEAQPASAAARKPQRDRRQQKNFRDLLDADDE